MAIQTIDDPTKYIRKMIAEFQIPGQDALAECLLAVPGNSVPVWDSGIFVSTEQSEHFYSDIFQFWVRSFFCFVEDVQAGPIFRDAAAHVECHEITSETFQQEYLALLHERVQDSSFSERQAYPKTRIELEGRRFSKAYVILDCPHIKSSVADSGDEFVAYFIIV